MKERFLSFLEKNKFRLIGGAVGLVIAVLMLTINFWRTLLLCCLTAVGCLIGISFEPNGREKIASVLAAILPKKR